MLPRQRRRRGGAKIELAGKAAVLLTAVPLFRAMLEIIKGLII